MRFTLLIATLATACMAPAEDAEPPSRPAVPLPPPLEGDAAAITVLVDPPPEDPATVLFYHQDTEVLIATRMTDEGGVASAPVIGETMVFVLERSEGGEVLRGVLAVPPRETLVFGHDQPIGRYRGGVTLEAVH